MPVTETDVCNDALAQIGAALITAIDDGSVNSNYCKLFYTPLRRALLRSHHWNFAEDRAVLVQDVATPLFEFAFSYNLPSDLLKVKEYNGADTTTTLVDGTTVVAGRYKIEGDRLYTNDGEVKIVYVKDVTDAGRWDPLFYQVMSTWLASKLCNAIVKDVSRSTELLRQVVDLLLPFATAVDGQEGSVSSYIVDDLTRGR